MNGNTEQIEIDYAARAREQLGFSRWWLLLAAAVSMALVSPYQYVWSSIEGPLSAQFGIQAPALGAVFTLFVIFQAGSQFPVGWWRDKRGPKALSFAAAALAGGGYIGLAYATAVWQVYVLYSLGAIGVGIVYTVSVNTALKWFPDRPGLTTGIGTMAFAAGSALVVPFVRANATAASYPFVLRTLGVIIGLGIFIGALILRDPPDRWAEAQTKNTENGLTETDSDTRDTPEVAQKQYTWREVLRTWQFWVMYGMFIAVSGAGLMLTAKVVSFANALGLTAVTATASATLLPVAGGAGRLILGDLSDRVPRERAMAVSFTLCGVGLAAVVYFAQNESALGFLAAVIMTTFFWSPQYTLFPSVVGTYYGSANSSANYALLYSGKMWGGVFGGAAAGWLVNQVGWSGAFLTGSGLAIIAGVAALALRSPKISDTEYVEADVDASD
ncbi:OFA family MFS transporter [Haloquadratum walsbyi]|jgi:Sugar phosphate permease|uniref:Sugar phosphate permease n=1 Tax=Haloquadratum walsbyi J07HQW2 TaxID=1238425 RepID=U1PQW4_9EURY|nr:OFA family MFS transporter [Haloquadratum walsbyi]ERG96157.1 MAG: sugar phosphate permease [Haloquadratum walsbyi J07HQW2]